MTEYNTLAEALDANKVKNAVQKKNTRKMIPGQSVAAITPDELASKYAKKRRTGKTGRDHANGNPARNQARKDARTEWQHNNRATNATFPV